MKDIHAAAERARDDLGNGAVKTVACRPLDRQLRFSRHKMPARLITPDTDHP